MTLHFTQYFTPPEHTVSFYWILIQYYDSLGQYRLINFVRIAYDSTGQVRILCCL